MPVTGMKNEPTAKLVSGVGELYISLPGVAFPAVTGDTLTWLITPGNWTKITNATKGGFAVRYKESVVDHRIDQQGMPVMKTFDTAEGDVTLELASMDHDLLVFALSNASITPTAAGPGQVGLSTLGIGGSAIKEFQIGIEALAPGSPLAASPAWYELVKIWRVVPSSELKKAYQKGEMQMVSIKWDIMADLSKSNPVCEIVEKTAEAET